MPISTAGRLFTIAGWAAFLGMSAVPMRADILSNNLFKTPSATYTVSGNTLVAASFRTGASASTLNSATLLLANKSRAGHFIHLERCQRTPWYAARNPQHSLLVFQ